MPASDVDQFRQAAALEIKAAQDQSNRFRAEYPLHALKFDYKFKQDKKPFRLSAIYHDDRLTYIHSTATEKPTFYEIKDGQPALVNYTLQDGVYVIDHVVDKGYLSIGKHKRHLRGKESDQCPPHHKQRHHARAGTPELSTAAAPVNNLRIAATGVIPKRMQSWIFLTVLLVTAVGLWFSSGSTKAAKPKPGTAASARRSG